jgi:hypothetical protein
LLAAALLAALVWTLRLLARRLIRILAGLSGLEAGQEEPSLTEDDIAASEFLAASHLVPDELAMVADELEVEVLHLTASATLAGCCLLDVADPLTEGEVCRLDRILEARAVELFGDRINEGSIAFEFGEAERRTEHSYHRVHYIGNDVLSVVEFKAVNHSTRRKGRAPGELFVGNWNRRTSAAAEVMPLSRTSSWPEVSCSTPASCLFTRRRKS